MTPQQEAEMLVRHWLEDCPVIANLTGEDEGADLAIADLARRIAPLYRQRATLGNALLATRRYIRDGYRQGADTVLAQATAALFPGHEDVADSVGQPTTTAVEA